MTAKDGDLGALRMTHLRLLALVAALAAAACVPPPDTEPLDDDDVADDDDVEYEPVWSSLFPLLNYRCSCHRANEGGRGGFVGMEDQDTAYDALVGQPSNDLPDLNRIEPFAPDDSYAWLKIRGEHRAAGGEGSRMPPTGNPLPEDQQVIVRAWIEAGAPR